METAEVTEETCFIVVGTTQGNRNFSNGIVVDRVQEVLDITSENQKRRRSSAQASIPINDALLISWHIANQK